MIVLVLSGGCTPSGGEPTTEGSSGLEVMTTSSTFGGSETGGASEVVPPTSGTDTGEVTGSSSGGASESTGELDTTTGGGSLCDADRQGISATLVHWSGPEMGCETIVLTNRLEMSPSPGVFDVDACGCNSPCESPDPWQLTIVAPMAALPADLPVCHRLVFEQAWNADMTACEFVALSVWDLDSEAPFGVYHAATRVAPTAEAVEIGWAVVSSVNEACECEECCRTPEKLDLSFFFNDVGLAQLAEGHDLIADVVGLPYRVRNLQSHDAGICDEAEEVDWVAVAEF
jgi:hypothetical protein